jgi:hypothetical protein
MLLRWGDEDDLLERLRQCLPVLCAEEPEPVVCPKEVANVGGTHITLQAVRQSYM